MRQIKVIKVICRKCERIMKDIPSGFRQDPRLIVEVTKSICEICLVKELKKKKEDRS